MKKIKNICCPVCKSNLVSKEIGLSCVQCKKVYKVADDIPVLVNLDELPVHLVGQIRYFEKAYVVENDKFELDEWQKSYVRRFENNFSDINGKTVLDCGAGSGYMSIELAKRGAKVTACDLTLKGLKTLKRVSDKLGLDIDIICCSAEELPFKDNSFDYFISNAVLEHLPREKAAISEISRVCKDESGLMVTVPLSYRFLNPLLMLVNYIHDKRIGHLRRYDKRKFENRFKGWDMKRIYYTGHTKKVIKTLINMIRKVFDNQKIEIDDAKKEDKVLWASNIICFMKKVRS